MIIKMLGATGLVVDGTVVPAGRVPTAVHVRQLLAALPS
jgi:hypothetical protein